jgi:hypothetical protein
MLEERKAWGRTFGSDVDEDDALAFEEGEGDVEVLEVVHLEARVDVKAGPTKPLPGEELEQVAQRHAAAQLLIQPLQLHLPFLEPVVAPCCERLHHQHHDEHTTTTTTTSTPTRSKCVRNARLSGAPDDGK